MSIRKLCIGIQPISRRVRMIIILAIFFMCVSMISNACSKTDTNIKHYMNTGARIDEEAKWFLPPLSEFSNSKSIKYSYTTELLYVFRDHTIVLDVKYDDDIYEIEKEELINKYTFYKGKLDDKYILYEENTLDKESLEDSQFSINSYTFRIVTQNEYNTTSMPKSFAMIGESDEKKSIVYLYYYDFDMDYIGFEGETNIMSNFVKREFNYNF